MNMKSKRGLGRGLDALFENNNIKYSSQKSLDIMLIEPNKKQPRKDFDEEALLELAESIKKHGVLQPIIVSQIEEKSYKIVAGERRWRAARIAGLLEIPVIIKNIEENEVMKIALVENLQRKDLSVIEEALGYKNLIDEFGLTQEEVAQAVSKPRSVIANILRLLNLPDIVLKQLNNGLITKGHAKVLLSLQDNAKIIELTELIVKNNLNVRQLEDIIKKSYNSKTKQKERLETFYSEAQIILSENLNTGVRIKKLNNKYILELDFYTKEDLEDLTKKLVQL